MEKKFKILLALIAAFALEFAEGNSDSVGVTVGYFACNTTGSGADDNSGRLDPNDTSSIYYTHSYTMEVVGATYTVGTDDENSTTVTVNLPAGGVTGVDNANASYAHLWQQK